ncbi:MAG: hypothetical protein Q4D77_08310 [Peptostreptococcaceae bacterium]|nr:hypothetical protein [Peptostreptococcaceae bacterium]
MGNSLIEIICDYCGTKNTLADQFCRNCGESTRPSVVPYVEKSAEEPSAEAKEPVAVSEEIPKEHNIMQERLEKEREEKLRREQLQKEQEAEKKAREAELLKTLQIPKIPEELLGEQLGDESLINNPMQQRLNEERREKLKRKLLEEAQQAQMMEQIRQEVQKAESDQKDQFDLQKEDELQAVALLKEKGIISEHSQDEGQRNAIFEHLGKNLQGQFVSKEKESPDKEPDHPIEPFIQRFSQTLNDRSADLEVETKKGSAAQEEQQPSFNKGSAAQEEQQLSFNKGDIDTKQLLQDKEDPVVSEKVQPSVVLASKNEAIDRKANTEEIHSDLSNISKIYEEIQSTRKRDARSTDEVINASEDVQQKIRQTQIADRIKLEYEEERPKSQTSEVELQSKEIAEPLKVTGEERPAVDAPLDPKNSVIQAPSVEQKDPYEERTANKVEGIPEKSKPVLTSPLDVRSVKHGESEKIVNISTLLHADQKPKVAERSTPIEQTSDSVLEKRSESKVESKPKAEAEVKPEAEAKPTMELKAETVSEPKAEPKAAVESKPKAEAKPMMELKAEPVSEPKAEPKAAVESKAEAKPTMELKAETVSEPKAEPKAAMEEKPKAASSIDLTRSIESRLQPEPKSDPLQQELLVEQDLPTEPKVDTEDKEPISQTLSDPEPSGSVLGSEEPKQIKWLDERPFVPIPVQESNDLLDVEGESQRDVLSAHYEREDLRSDQHTEMIYGLEKDRVERFIGKNSDYYLFKFNRLNRRRNIFTWNGAAFLLGEIWLIYRKRYVGLVGTYLMFVLLRFLPKEFVLPILALWRVALAFTVNYTYFRYVKKQVADEQSLNDPYLEAIHQKSKGGTNLGFAIGYVAFWVILISALIYIALYIAPEIVPENLKDLETFL